MKAICKDETTYSRDDKKRIPTTFTATYGSLKISITNGHIYYPGKWVMHCFVLHIDTQELLASTKEEAENEALSRVLKTIVRLENEFENLMNGKEEK